MATGSQPGGDPVLLEYIGLVSGPFSIVRGTAKYKFGLDPGHKQRYVHQEHLDWFLERPNEYRRVERPVPRGAAEVGPPIVAREISAPAPLPPPLPAPMPAPEPVPPPQPQPDPPPPPPPRPTLPEPAPEPPKEPEVTSEAEEKAGVTGEEKVSITDMTVVEIRGYAPLLATKEEGRATLQAWLEEEKAGKQRKTVLADLEKALAS